MTNKTKYSKTIKYRVSVLGISLRSGEYTKVTLSPSTEQGIRFFTNNKSNVIIPCSATSVVDTMFSTNIGKTDISISTVEHLMSALHWYGIDCIDISIDGDGVPILDGSADHFCNLIEAAGIKTLDTIKEYIVVDKNIKVCSDDSYIEASPYDGMLINMKIKFDHPLIQTQNFIFDVLNDDYKTEIAPARTFGIISDIEKLIETGIIKGGSFDNAIVLDKTGVMNTELKWYNEFVRHKVLDFMGDIYMHGPIKGFFKCNCSGHSLNNKLLNKIIENI